MSIAPMYEEKTSGGSDSQPDNSGDFTGTYTTPEISVSTKKYVYSLKENDMRQYKTTKNTNIETNIPGGTDNIVIFPNAGLVYVSPNAVEEQVGNPIGFKINNLRYRYLEDLSPSELKKVTILKNKEKAKVEQHISKLKSMAEIKNMANKMLTSFEGGQCKCPGCGYTTPRTIRQSCDQKTCPECGAKMTNQVNTVISKIFSDFKFVGDFMEQLEVDRDNFVSTINNFKEGMLEELEDVGVEPPEDGSPQTVALEQEYVIQPEPVIPVKPQPEGDNSTDERDNGTEDEDSPFKTIGKQVGGMVHDIRQLRNMMPDEFSADFDQIISDMETLPDTLFDTLVGPEYDNLPSAMQETMLGQYEDLTQLLSESVVGNVSGDVDTLLDKVDTTNVSLSTIQSIIEGLNLGDADFGEMADAINSMNESLQNVEDALSGDIDIPSIWEQFAQFLGLEAQAGQRPKQAVQDITHEMDKLESNLSDFKRISTQRAVEAEKELTKLKEADNVDIARKHVSREPIMDVMTGKDVLDKVKTLDNAFKKKGYPTKQTLQTLNTVLNEASIHMDGNNPHRSKMLKNLSSVRTELNPDESEDWLIEIADGLEWWDGNR